MKSIYVMSKIYKWLIVTQDLVCCAFFQEKHSPSLKIQQSMWKMLDIFQPPLKLGATTTPLLLQMMWAELCVPLQCYIFKCVCELHTHHYFSSPLLMARTQKYHL